MNSRLFLDANVLLNAIFVSGSFSDQAVRLALSNGVALFVGERTVREAVQKARDTARELGKRTDPNEVIKGAIRHFGAKQVAAGADDPVPREVPTNDAHVFAEAKIAGAAILTSDRALWLACETLGKPVFVPLQVIRHFNGFSTTTTAFGIPPTRESGSLFFRGFPVNWGGKVADGHFTGVHCPGVLWLYYDAAASQWVAEIDGRSSLRIGAKIKSETELQTVALSWMVGKNIQLRVGGIQEPISEPLIAPLPGQFSRASTIGIRADETCAWSGAIDYCIFGSRPISSTTWKKCLDHRALCPSPYDDDTLKAAVHRLLN